MKLQGTTMFRRIRSTIDRRVEQFAQYLVGECAIYAAKVALYGLSTIAVMAIQSSTAVKSAYKTINGWIWHYAFKAGLFVLSCCIGVFIGLLLKGGPDDADYDALNEARARLTEYNTWWLPDADDVADTEPVDVPLDEAAAD